MKQIIRKTILFTIVLTTFLGCYVSQQIKLAKQAESSGDYKLASESYYNALRKLGSKRNTAYLKASQGLSRTAPKDFETLLQKFRDLYASGDYSSAYTSYGNSSVRSYGNAVLDFQKKMQPYIDLTIPPSDKESYMKCKEILAQQSYDKGKVAMNDGNFSSSKGYFSKALAFIPNYRDASSLMRQAENAKNTQDAEKYYQQGMSSYQAKRYISAYNAFGNCLKKVPSYKDANSMRQQALSKGKIAIAIQPFSNSTSDRYATGKLRSALRSAISNFNTPFITIVDREMTQSIINEQRMSNTVGSSSIEMGNLRAVNYLLTGQVVNLLTSKDDIQEVNSYAAFRKYTVKKSDGSKTTKYKNVATVKEYAGNVKLTYEVEYQLVSVETGESTLLKQTSSSASDKVAYATVNTDIKNNLYYLASNLLGGGQSYYAINSSIFTARKRLKTSQDLSPSIMKEIAKKISSDVYSKLMNQ